VPLHSRSRLGIGVEVALERSDFPTYAADRVLGHRFNVRSLAAEDERRADELARAEEADGLLILSDAHLAAHDERHGVRSLAAFDEPLPGRRVDPGADAQDLENLAGRQVAEHEAPDLFFLGRQLDGSTLQVEPPRLQQIDDGKHDRPDKRRP